jgi:hypothetical protein
MPTSLAEIAILRTTALYLTQQAIEAGVAIRVLPPTGAAMLKGLACLQDFAAMSVAVQQVLDTCEMADQERLAFEAVHMLVLPYASLAIEEKRLDEALLSITGEAELAEYLASTRRQNSMPFGALLYGYRLAIERAQTALQLISQDKAR